MEEDIINDYSERISFAQQEERKYKQLSNRYSLYRLGIFGLFIIAVCAAISLDDILIVTLAAVLLSIVFGRLVKKQNDFDALNNYWIDIRKVNENEIKSIQSQANMYDDGLPFVSDKHHYTSDLDIFGANSLFQLINRAATWPGIVKLAQWLHKPADKATILARKQGVIEIAGKNDWRIDLQANLLFSLKQQKEQVKNLISYLKIPVELEDEKWLKTYIQFAPYLLSVAIVAGVFYVPVRYLIPVIAFYNYRQASSRKKVIEKADLIAGRIGKTLEHFVLAFKSIESEEWESAYLKNISAKLKNTPENVSAKILGLSGLINKLNYRLNLFVSFILNMFLIWDIKQIVAIEEWKKVNTENIEVAFDVIAEFEAIISLASLAINYPEWCYPEITESPGYTLITKNLAHPLISSKKRVANDYEINNTYKIDIITGSNMAGKSTFLRTIGINTVLALCGAPVCASEMSVSVMKIITYMRIKDSLNESTSTFKAELDRLQMLLNAAGGEQKVFFLIDEMLRGTNSVDKYLGSKAVIERLISKQAVGMVATHDLQIAELEAAHPDYIRNFYFDIEVKNGEMLFDYKIKHGECKTFNASLLLKQIGIDVAAE